MNEEQNYRLFVYWANGFKFKFRGEQFGSYSHSFQNFLETTNLKESDPLLSLGGL